MGLAQCDLRSARKLKRWTIIAGIALGSMIVTILLGNVRFFELVHLKASDLHFLLRGKRPTSNIVVIAVDKKSLDKQESYTARQGVTNPPADPHYTIRAWRGVVTYLLRRPEFLYE